MADKSKMGIKSSKKIAVVGLGYVGLPLLYQFSKKYDSIGFDIDKERVAELKNGYDRTKEIPHAELPNIKNLKLHSDEKALENANVFIITVPTPVDSENNPYLVPIISASEIVGKHLKERDVVIYESTVFPGCTEEVCVPVLEKNSGLSYNTQFFCGYSPERINPGDKDHTITKIKKVTSGSNENTAEFVDRLYSSIIKAGTFRASSIAVAEAAKIIENTQRDVNIALINELAMIFNKLNIDTKEVLDAAETKWNFLPFKPGLVGGHCIGVDPYYLTYKSKEIGYNPDIILAGRKINNKMGDYVVNATITALKKQGIDISDAKVAILGLTFKENCPDLRNTKVFSMCEKLESLKCQVSVSDSCAELIEIENKFGHKPMSLEDLSRQNAIILAVGHQEYMSFSMSDWSRMLMPNGVLIDVKSIYNKKIFLNSNIRYWSL